MTEKNRDRQRQRQCLRGDPDADTKQMKAFLAAEIIAALNRRHLTVRAAAEVTGVRPSDISNIRNAHLGKFIYHRSACAGAEPA
ncbi:XRE family transcriptional regulator [Mesorhizobium sp. M0019]|uniref:XRE family transcriptional regulator n=1 Tax=Mesorhizobium sp. M0019 TaxID=2956845 RepID=UPI0033379C36